MLSKEEIKKAKEITQNYIKDTPIVPYDCLMNEERKSAETLLKYIDQLEQENKDLRFIQECDTDRIYQLEQENDTQNKIIDEMAKYLAIVRDCPNEDKGANLDCENRCSNNDSIYAECWKQYFKKKVEEG